MSLDETNDDDSDRINYVSDWFVECTLEIVTLESWKKIVTRVYILEKSLHDEKECDKQLNFKRTTCAFTTFHNGKACSELTDFNLAVLWRENYYELTKKEVDLVIKTQINNDRFNTNNII